MDTTHIRVLQCQPVEVCFFRPALFFEFVSCGQCRLISFVFANAQKNVAQIIIFAEGSWETSGTQDCDCFHCDEMVQLVDTIYY